ncbi:MAG TPA: glycosyltransferase [Terracidiphilus sp.]|jgi:ceramide glucosyltransferase|nr:glycosyltransferase [Terracidiphilus sp.]
MPYILVGLAAFGLLTSSVFAGMVLWAVPGYLRERRAALAQVAARPGFTPPLTLLKPVHGAEPGLEAHLATFFQQDYPEYEILFCARSIDDAGLDAARRVALKFPQIPTKFLATGGIPDYINAKVASMELMEANASHEILVISDSDVRVTPDYLRSVALPFADHDVGAMCCPYRGVAAEGGLWARLEAVGMSVEMTAGVLAARITEGMRFVLGPTMAFRRDAIRGMGGFRVTAEYCADDFVLGNETYKLGKSVVLSHHAIDHIVLNSRFADSMKHQVRWMKSTRFSRPAGHFGTALSFSMPFGFLGLAAMLWLGHPWWGVAMFGWAVATRLALSFAVGGQVVNDRDWVALLILYPLRDLMGFGFWAASYWGRRILWRGRIFELLPGGKMRAAG